MNVPDGYAIERSLFQQKIYQLEDQVEALKKERDELKEDNKKLRTVVKAYDHCLDHDSECDECPLFGLPYLSLYAPCQAMWEQLKDLKFKVWEGDSRK